MSRPTPWDQPTAHLGEQQVGSISLYQVIAYNLAEARRERRLTQDELGARLEELTGRKWSRATVSAAESSWDAPPHGRVRHFDVSDVAAFALALRLPLAWFFLPPPTNPSGDAPAQEASWINIGKKEAGETVTSRRLHELVLRHREDDDPDQILSRRLRREGAPVAPKLPDLLSELERLVATLRDEAEGGEQ